MSAPESRTARRVALEIFTASLIVLFQELALIRWLPGQIRVLAYFPNVVLIAAFLGLGVGALRARSRSILWLWPLSLAAVVAAAVALSNIAFTHESASEHLWLLYFDLPPDAHVVESIRLPIVGAFLLSALTFVPFGQLIASRIAEFRRLGSSLWGYCWDLLGSLAGVVLFAVASFQRTFPVVWFSVIFLCGTVLVLRFRRATLVWALGAVATIGLVHAGEKAQVYSPYYALRLVPEAPDGSFVILTNRSLHQRAVPLREADTPLLKGTDWMRQGYHAPYRLLGRKARNVLVVGAGTGNDVAVALDEGAQRIDAVEIDPVIFELGERHPNRPYASSRVRKINNDARAYLNETDQSYDVIVFGTLDSQTRLSALSNVRLDNFVYTLECMKAARRRLTADGAVFLYFAVNKPFLDRHLRALLHQAFDEIPVATWIDYGMFNRIYMAGPGFDHLRRQGRTPSRQEVEAYFRDATYPTDDWPYLYLENRHISTFYLSLIAIFAALSILIVFGISGEMRASLRHGGFDAEMFLFGVAFLLLETKLVTEMNLAWGATWLTSAVVFGSILTMILIGTVLMQLRPLPWRVCFAGLAASLLLTYMIPVSRIATLNEAARLFLSLLFAGTPIFFASVCFALLFRERPRPDVAFGWNLLGAVVGGLLEFTSMAIGLRNMTLLALVAYLIAFLMRERHVAVGPAPAPQNG